MYIIHMHDDAHEGDKTTLSCWLTSGAAKHLNNDTEDEDENMEWNYVYFEKFNNGF